MTSSKEYEVGYGKPPKHSRWKKGQSGNPKRRYRRSSKGIVELIDDLFAQQIEIFENGTARRVSILEAIITQLWINEVSGNRRALAVRLQYQVFARSQRKDWPEIIIEGGLPGDYSE